MSDFQIRIKIVEKEYTLKATDPKDEALLRQAAKLLNERAKHIQKHSGVLDKQDLLAMVAFDYAVQAFRLEQAAQQQTVQVEKLSSLIDKTLSE